MYYVDVYHKEKENETEPISYHPITFLTYPFGSEGQNHLDMRCVLFQGINKLIVDCTALCGRMLYFWNKYADN